MAEKLGRPLRRDELVHHQDGDFTNDDPDNLEIISHQDHVNYHLKGRKRSRLTRKRISEAQLGKPKGPGFGDKVSAALKGKRWSSERKERHCKFMRDHFKKYPRQSPTGRPWIKLGVSRRTWYRHRRKQNESSDREHGIQ